MDWLTFFQGVISAVSWPAALVLLACILRHEIRALLSSLRRVKYRGWEVELGRRVEAVWEGVVQQLPSQSKLATDLTHPIALVTDLPPRVAVREFWRGVETAAVDAAERIGGHKTDSPLSIRDALTVLERYNHWYPPVMTLLRDLLALRNEAAHAPEFALSKESVLQYAASCEAVIGYLKGLPGSGGNQDHSKSRS
jgi:hypothetical protein